MIDFKKYKRFFAFGCSMTSYGWPTWADIIAQEISESYNYAQSGGGNLFIASQIAEANTRHKFNETDLVMVMWSSIAREDRWLNGKWLTPGNIYTQDFYNQKFIEEFVDNKGMLIRDMAIITMCKGMLDNLKIDYHMMSMAPFIYMQFSSPNQKFDNGEDVLEFYKDTINAIKPDILTVECNGKWPQHPIKKNGGQSADYHPSPRQHFNYLNKIFADIQWSKQTLKYVKKSQAHMESLRDFDEMIFKLPPTRL